MSIGRSIVAILVLAVLAGCATVPRQSATARAAAIRDLKVGDVVEISYTVKDGWGTSTCRVAARDDEGVTCGGDRLLFENVTSIRHPSRIRAYALIPFTPVLVGGWMAAMLVCPACGPGDPPADCPITDKDIVRSGKTTRIIAIGKPPGSVSEYKSDADPDTLELVSLERDDDGPSRVSDDGEVIFLAPQVTDKEQQQLVTQALYIRAVLRKGLTARCRGPWTHPSGADTSHGPLQRKVDVTVLSSRQDRRRQ